MTEQERNRYIAEKLNEGHSLSDVQRLLDEECGEKITFMELRLLAAELEVDWDRIDAEQGKGEQIVEDVTKAPVAGGDGEGRALRVGLREYFDRQAVQGIAGFLDGDRAPVGSDLLRERIRRCRFRVRPAARQRGQPQHGGKQDQKHSSGIVPVGVLSRPDAPGEKRGHPA